MFYVTTETDILYNEYIHKIHIKNITYSIVFNIVCVRMALEGMIDLKSASYYIIKVRRWEAGFGIKKVFQFIWNFLMKIWKKNIRRLLTATTSQISNFFLENVWPVSPNVVQISLGCRGFGFLQMKDHALFKRDMTDLCKSECSKLFLQNR